jgi:hypothetical protein
MYHWIKSKPVRKLFLMDDLYFLFQPTRAPYQLPNHPSKKFARRPEKKMKWKPSAPWKVDYWIFVWMYRLR